MIKGNVQIDLHNHRSGFTERYEDENLFTNAIDIISKAIINVRSVGERMIPLYSNALGGLYLFDNTLTEDKSNILIPSDAHILAYADQHTDSSNPLRGSFNVLESKLTNTGYTSVWDFSTSQANGVIKSLSRTGASLFDLNSNDSRPGYAIPAFRLADYNGSTLRSVGNSSLTPDGNRTNSYDYSWVHYDNKSQYLYGFCTQYVNNNSTDLRIYRCKLPFTSYTLWEGYSHVGSFEYVGSIDSSNLQTIDYSRSEYYTFNKLTKEQRLLETITTTKGGCAQQGIHSGHDGYAYVTYVACKTYNDSDKTKNGTNATVYYRRFKTSDNSFELDPTEYSFSCGNAAVQGTSYDSTDYRSPQAAGRAAVICKGYAYVMGNDLRTVYIYDLNNPTIRIDAQLPEGCTFSNSYSYQSNYEIYRIERKYMIGMPNGGVVSYCSEYDSKGQHIRNYELIIYPDGTIIKESGRHANDFMSQTDGNKETKYMFDNMPFFYCSYSNGYDHFFDIGLINNYLGTICNLGTPVVKTPETSMKITYTLTQV